MRKKKQNSSYNTDRVIKLLCVLNYGFFVLFCLIIPLTGWIAWTVLWMGQNKQPALLHRPQFCNLLGSTLTWRKFSYMITKRGKHEELEKSRKPMEVLKGLMLGVLHSPGHRNNIYVMGATIPVAQIVWGFLLKGLISTRSNVSRSELFKATFSIAKICVSFIKMFFLKFRVGCCLAKV